VLDNIHIDDIIIRALKEDMALGDITTDNLIDPESKSTAYLVAKEPGIIAGIQVAERVFTLLDDKVGFLARVEDGQHVEKGEIIAQISGHTSVLLKGERTALNFLQRMSGIATLTNAFCKKVEGTKAVIVDTRKTTPGLRILEKYAVRAGGGRNHRFSLSDGVLIKDNHINACGGIRQAVEKARASVPHTVRIEVEVETLEQVQEALDCGADIIMLDNMDIDTMAKAVKMINGRAIVEASGSVSLETARSIAEAGVDVISVGRITHSAPALDISMKFQ